MATIYTLVPDGETCPWLDACTASAVGQGRHVIVPVKQGEFFSARKLVYTNSGQRHGYVCCLDWDDILHPQSVAACKKVLSTYNAGCAFTWQDKIDEYGVQLSKQVATVSRLELSSVPESIHHLCVLDSARIPLDVLDLIEKVAPLCVDWLVRAYVALRFGAVQVPMLGYSWRMHAGQTSRTLGDAFSEQIPFARALARSWAPLNATLLHSAFKVARDADLPNA
jgi:hypothetical protein